eukprot:TRINITY_DN5061_c0_g1_i1.p2 TRINITY_DN5061_c0_g1~~TRINITY_DN5061_c0_g1_i1.p2  ORF type:complete len:288 (+),score=-13.51 TRINITY_DN5061_c0_g1_i1:322-1185(+)
MGSLWGRLRWRLSSDEEIEDRAMTALDHYYCGYKKRRSPVFNCVASWFAEISIYNTLKLDYLVGIDPDGDLMDVGNAKAVEYFYKYTTEYVKMVLAAARAGVPFVCPVCERRKKKKEQMAQNLSGHGLESKSLTTVDNSFSESNCGQTSSQPLIIKRQIKQIWSPFQIFPFVNCSGIFQWEVQIQVIQSKRQNNPYQNASKFSRAQQSEIWVLGLICSVLVAVVVSPYNQRRFYPKRIGMAQQTCWNPLQIHYGTTTQQNSDNSRQNFNCQRNFPQVFIDAAQFTRS